ncbi:MAG TPA: signal peptidase I [Caulobacteraceae bacterium]|nr:signal peptidase I [Caulobacteraceae bacterium]
MTEAAEMKPADAEKSAAQEVVEIVKTVVYALLIALVLRILLFQPFTIPSGSMEPTLLEGDYIIVSKYSYGYSRHSIPFSPDLFEGRIFERPPERGDIIVFKLPRDGRTDYIKRLVGLPGDRIQVRDGAVHVNGEPMTRKDLGVSAVQTDYGFTRQVKRYLETQGTHTYTTYDYGPDGEVDNTDVFIVPEDHYFFMGDNRDNSLDSRVPPESQGVGMVPAENLVGKAQIILLSWHPEAALFKPWTWVTEARPSRFFNLLK